MRRWWAAVAVALAAAACSAPAQDAAGPAAPDASPTARVVAPTSEASPAGAGDVGAVPVNLDWSASLVGGGQLEGSSLAGGDVALWFWAPW